MNGTFRQRCKYILFFLVFLILPLVSFQVVSIAAENSIDPQVSKAQKKIAREEGCEFELAHKKINTEDAAPADTGDVEWTTTYSWLRAVRTWDNNWDLSHRPIRSKQRVQTQIAIGVFRNLELAANMGYLVLVDKANGSETDTGEVSGPTKGYGFSDIAISPKWRFYQNEKHKIQIAYLPGFTIPSGRRDSLNHLGPSQKYGSFDEMLAVSKDWGRWALSADAGYSLPIGRRRENNRGTLVSDFAGGYHIFKWLQPEMEINYAHDFVNHENDSNLFAMTAGIILQFKDVLITTGIQQALFGNNTNMFTHLKSSIRYCF